MNSKIGYNYEIKIFLRDPDGNIKQVHMEQFVDRYIPPFTVGHEQRLMGKDFEKLRKTNDRFISCNSFLSISIE